MRWGRTLVGLVGTLALSGCAATFAVTEETPQPIAVSAGGAFFVDGLASNDGWTWVAPYGDVWIPASVTPDWRPYTSDRWVNTNSGWDWSSVRPWGGDRPGDTPRDGRWVHIDRRGWVWVPGSEGAEPGRDRVAVPEHPVRGDVFMGQEVAPVDAETNIVPRPSVVPAPATRPMPPLGTP